MESRQVTVSDAAVALTSHEVNLLKVLLEDRGRVIPFNELAERAWGYGATGDQRFIYTAAWRLRRALAAAGAPNVVESMRGVGYSIPQDVTHQAPGLRVLAVFDPMDPEWRLSMVNSAAAELSGHSVEALITAPGAAMGLWHPDDRVILDETTEHALTIAPAVIAHVRLIRADGGTVPVDIAVSGLDLPGGAPLALAVVTPSTA